MTGPEQRLWASHIRPYLARERAERGLFFAKVHGSRFSSGLPDLLVSFVGADGLTRSTWFEMKSPGKRPTPKQRSRADDLWRGGQSVYLATDVEDVRAWVDGRWVAVQSFRMHGAGEAAGPGRRALYEIRTDPKEV